jgi:hypothetical protein
MNRLSKVMALLAIVVVGCGDPVMEKDFRGDPLFSFEGSVVTYIDDRHSDHTLRVSPFWNPDGVKKVLKENLREQSSASVTVSFPAKFEINIFRPPKPEDLVKGEPKYGMALMVVYKDFNDDGHYSAHDSDEFFGSARDHVLFYAPQTIDPAISPIGIALPQGFSLLRMPMRCKGHSFSHRSTARELPLLGHPCSQSKECGPGGYCLNPRQDCSFINGYCSSLQPASFDKNTAVPVDLQIAFWLRRCVDASDCQRDGYRCLHLETQAFSDQCNVCWPMATRKPTTVSCGISLGYGSYSDCISSIGRACRTHSDCGSPENGDHCLTELDGQTFPGGMCTHRFNKPTCPLGQEAFVSMGNRAAGTRNAERKTTTPATRFCMPAYPILRSI